MCSNRSCGSVGKGGHPSLIENLQLAHMSCNRIKSDKLFADNSKAEPKQWEIEIFLRVKIGQSLSVQNLKGVEPTNSFGRTSRRHCTFFRVTIWEGESGKN